MTMLRHAMLQSLHHKTEPGTAAPAKGEQWEKARARGGEGGDLDGVRLVTAAEPLAAGKCAVQRSPGLGLGTCGAEGATRTGQCHRWLQVPRGVDATGGGRHKRVQFRLRQGCTAATKEHWGMGTCLFVIDHSIQTSRECTNMYL